MAALADPILRGVLFLFSTIALAVTAAYAHDTSSPRVNFAVFAAAFSLLFGVFANGVAAFVSFIPTFIVSVFDFLNWVFLFTGATAVAAKIRCHSCGNKAYRDAFFGGSEKDCRLAQTGVAFLYFSWAVAVALFVYSLLATLRGGNFGIPGRRKTSVPRTGVPTMSQV